MSNDGHGSKVTRTGRHSPPLEDPRLKNRPPEPSQAASSNAVPTKKKKKDKEVVGQQKNSFICFNSNKILFSFL